MDQYPKLVKGESKVVWEWQGINSIIELKVYVMYCSTVIITSLSVEGNILSYLLVPNFYCSNINYNSSPICGCLSLDLFICSQGLFQGTE